METQKLNGPFASSAECMADAEAKVVGPDCGLTHGGTWDPKWSVKQ
jgi:hypothetical protein